MQKYKFVFSQMMQYGAVALIALVCDFSILWILTELAHVYYLLSSVFAFCVGLIVNYFFSVTFVFKTRKITDTKKEFLIFFLIGVIGLGLTALLLWFFTDVVGFYYLISKVITTGLVFLFNFFGRRQILFVEKVQL